MKKLIGAFLSSLLVANPALADLYKASFTAPNNKGAASTYGFVVDLQFNDSGSITGEIKEFYGANACRWPGLKIAGNNLQDGNFRWASEENIIKGCGRLVFIGKKDGDKLTGHLPRFQGGRVDLELESTK